ncbi:MAG TPA: hypothetical protein VIU39_04260 [Anaerolineales bacterium]|jgi:hypothetical protein
MPRIRINLRRVLTIAGIIILILMIVDFNRRIEVMNSLSRQADIRRAQATQAVQTQMSLQTQVAFAASTEAVNDWARTEGHYVQDGDQPVVPVGQPGSDPVVTPEPLPTPTPLSNWQVWWDLFFNG